MPKNSELWAILPDALTEYLDAVPTQAAALRPSSGNQPEAPEYQLDHGLAIVPVSGVLRKTAQYFWGVKIAPGMRDISAAVQAAAADTEVQAIVLDVDSPGGTVDGVEELAAEIAKAAAVKPVYAYADGMMCSAAYWLSAGAREIAACATAVVGSIGVIMTHCDMTRAAEQAGRKYTLVAAGHFKTVGNAFEPLTDETKAYLQAHVDATYGLFLDAVAAGRGVDREKVLAMADGRIFTGAEAQPLGLTDHVCSLSEFLAHIRAELTKENQTMAKDQTQNKEEEKQPDGAKSATTQPLTAEAQAEALAAARAEGAADERERLLSIAGCLFTPNQSAMLAVCAKTTITTDQLVALRDGFVQLYNDPDPAEKQAEMSIRLADMRAAHDKKPVAPVTPEDTKDFKALVDAAMAEGMSRTAAIRQVANTHPDLHAAWLRAAQK